MHTHTPVYVVFAWAYVWIDTVQVYLGDVLKNVINNKYVYYKVYYSMHHIIIKNKLYILKYIPCLSESNKLFKRLTHSKS